MELYINGPMYTTSHFCNAGLPCERRWRIKSADTIHFLIYKIVRNTAVGVIIHCAQCQLLHPGARKGERLESEEVSITVNGKQMRVAAGTNVAAAVIMSGEPCRFSVHGEARAPLCGMGICMECRMTVNGVAHLRSCQLLCAPGMEVASE